MFYNSSLAENFYHSQKKSTLGSNPVVDFNSMHQKDFQVDQYLNVRDAKSQHKSGDVVLIAKCIM